jgi:hypothetical protein
VYIVFDELSETGQQLFLRLLSYVDRNKVLRESMGIPDITITVQGQEIEDVQDFLNVPANVIAPSTNL